MYACMHVCMYVYMYVCIYIYVHTLSKYTCMYVYTLGYSSIKVEKCPLMDELSIQMVIFYVYVSLPQGIDSCIHHPNILCGKGKPHWTLGFYGQIAGTPGLKFNLELGASNNMVNSTQ